MTYRFLIFLFTVFIFSKKALHMFQQNRYEGYRYFNWQSKYLKANKYIIVFYILYFTLLISLYLLNFKLIMLIVASVFTVYMMYKEAKTIYIKPLVYTFRVKRQIFVMAILFIITGLLINNYYLISVHFLLPYLYIYLMHIITLPIEKTFHKMFLNDAKKKLLSNHNLIRIGITGSYGKTSSKNILGEVLSEKLYTLISPASFNTPMGLSITIRNDLKNIHQVFVAEMGADKVGEIVELAEFIQPKYGIVTSIGPQHLMTFKSIENIIDEKMALIEHLPSDGVGVINKDSEYIKNYQIKNDCKVISYGIENPDVDYFGFNIKYSINGSSFDVKHLDQVYHFETKLLGEHNISNILASIALAMELNISIEDIIKAVKKVSYVQHRLELKKINNLTFIDNAFNSNPASALMSLKVLENIDAYTYIITPGLIDLGSIENQENYNFGYNMKDKVDEVILIGKIQSQHIYKGLKASGFNLDKVFIYDNVKEGFAHVYKNATVDDVILLENDLPDAFNY